MDVLVDVHYNLGVRHPERFVIGSQYQRSLDQVFDIPSVDFGFCQLSKVSVAYVGCSIWQTANKVSPHLFSRAFIKITEGKSQVHSRLESRVNTGETIRCEEQHPSVILKLSEENCFKLASAWVETGKRRTGYELVVDNFAMDNPDRIATLPWKLRAISGDKSVATKELTELEDQMTYGVDNSFAIQFYERLKRLGSTVILPKFLENSGLCESCSNATANILSDIFEMIISQPDMRSSSPTDCEVCTLLNRILGLEEYGRVFREGSNLKIEGRDIPILSLCATPGQLYTLHKRCAFLKTIADCQ